MMRKMYGNQTNAPKLVLVEKKFQIYIANWVKHMNKKEKH